MPADHVGGQGVHGHRPTTDRCRMNAVRDMSNLGPHGEEVDAADAIRVMRDLIDVLEWYVVHHDPSCQVAGGPEARQSLEILRSCGRSTRIPAARDHVCPVHPVPGTAATWRSRRPTRLTTTWWTRPAGAPTWRSSPAVPGMTTRSSAPQDRSPRTRALLRLGLRCGVDHQLHRVCSRTKRRPELTPTGGSTALSRIACSRRGLKR